MHLVIQENVSYFLKKKKEGNTPMLNDPQPHLQATSHHGEAVMSLSHALLYSSTT